MSTQPLARRRLRPVSRRPAPGRALSIAATFALVFGAAFAVGHTKGTPAATGEHLPPSLQSVPTPIPSALAPAPAIEVAVLKPPPAPRVPVKRESAPLVTSVAPTPAPSATPAPSVTPAPSATPAPAPATAPAAAPKPPATRSEGGSSGSGSGPGTSFESSE